MKPVPIPPAEPVMTIVPFLVIDLGNMVNINDWGIYA